MIVAYVASDHLTVCIQSIPGQGDWCDRGGCEVNSIIRWVVEIVGGGYMILWMEGGGVGLWVGGDGIVGGRAWCRIGW